MPVTATAKRSSERTSPLTSGDYLETPARHIMTPGVVTIPEDADGRIDLAALERVLVAEETFHVLGLGGVPAEEVMLAQLEEVAGRPDDIGDDTDQAFFHDLAIVQGQDGARFPQNRIPVTEQGQEGPAAQAISSPSTAATGCT